MDTELIITPAQVAHLKANASLVAEHQHDANNPSHVTTVEEWLAGAEEDAAHEGYYYLCLDIGIAPLTPHPKGA